VHWFAMKLSASEVLNNVFLIDKFYINE
jgi:hypothetical protein